MATKITRPTNYVEHRGQRVDTLTARSWLAYQLTNEAGDDESTAALRHHRINPAHRNLAIELPQNALSTAGLTRGAGLVAEGFLSGWLRAQSAVNAIRSTATIIPVNHGGTWRKPWVDGRNIEGEILIENAASTATGDVEFAAGILRLHRFASRSTRVPNSLIEDSPNFDEQIGYVLGDQVALRQNRAFTLGTGVGEPEGIVTRATQVTGSSTSLVAPSDFALLIKAVGDAHADPATAYLMMHPDIFAHVLSTGDGNGGRLYEFFDGRLMGYRVLLNGAMDSVVQSAAKTIVFGNFSRYAIAEAPAVELQAARETYAEFNQTVFRAVAPADGRVMQPADVPFSVLVH